MTTFNNRVFGCVLVKSINSNYNADFSHQPRTLPNGVVYATDKVLKYAIRNYLRDIHTNDGIFYFKTLKPDLNPMDVPDRYKSVFKTEVKNDSKQKIAQNLLSQLDIRLFGATFAPKGDGIKDKNISIHGSVQINHGINIWKENNIYSEQIMSPFSNPNEKKNGDDQAATTLGRQSKLQEGHYLHHFSVNPKNLSHIAVAAGEGAQSLSVDDITKLKTALRTGVTYYDSAAKAGTDNEALIWVQLNENSNRVLPNFTQLVKMYKDDDKVVYDLQVLTEVLADNDSEIAAVEIYYLKGLVNLQNAPIKKTKKFDLNSGNEIK